MNGLMMDYQLTLDRILEYAQRIHSTKRVITRTPAGSVHQYTFKELYRRVKRLASALESLGVKEGDRIGTLAWNHYQHLELYYGIPGCGAVCHTLNLRLAPDQLRYIIEHAEDRIIFVDATVLPLLEKVVTGLDFIQHFVLLNAEAGISTRLPHVLHYEDLIAGGKEEYEWRSKNEQRAMGLCYTSGTTGNPKGALYSHRSMFLHTLGINLSCALGISERDVVLPVVPMFHAMAWGLPYACLMNGADIVMPGPHLQPARLAEMISEFGVTIAAGVPTIWAGLYQELKTGKYDPSALKVLIVGGAAMPRVLIEGFEKDFGINVLHAWGMTEMSPLGTVSLLRSHHQNLSDEEKWNAKAKQGYPAPLVEMRIVNDAGEELPWDGHSVGEIQVRGPWIIRQYYKLDPSPDQFTADGWFRTGDVACIDPDGCMNITDRTKDVIKSGGEWISSVALENAIVAHPKVQEAAVIAVPDPRWNERPMAVIVPRPNTDPVTREEICDFLAPQFPKFWLPDRIVLVETIPRTSVGKIDKKALRNQFKEWEG